MVQQSPSISKPTGPVQAEGDDDECERRTAAPGRSGVGERACARLLSLDADADRTGSRRHYVRRASRRAILCHLVNAAAPEKREYAGTVNFFAVSASGVHVGHHHPGAFGRRRRGHPRVRRHRCGAQARRRKA